MELQIDSPKFINNEKLPLLSPSGSGRETDQHRFKFTGVQILDGLKPIVTRNKSAPAHKLFVDGVIIPLHLIDSRANPINPDPESEIPTQLENPIPLARYQNQIPEPNKWPKCYCCSEEFSELKIQPRDPFLTDSANEGKVARPRPELSPLN